MSGVSRWGKVLLGIGIVLALFQFAMPAGLLVGPVGVIAPLVGLWWALLLLGIAGLAVARFGLNLPTLRTQTPISREDIIQPTNWARNSRYVLRRSFGVALAVSSVVLLIVALALGETGLAILWILTLLLGIVWLVLGWRYSLDIVDHHTHTLSVRVPDLFAVHSFHVALRQQAEDLGYVIQRDTSPGSGGQSSAYNGEVFHANGGFKARKRPVGSSRILFPELDDDPYLSQVATVATLGVFALFLGITLITIAQVSIGMMVATGQLDPALVSGLVFLLVGIVLVAYDYVTRTREWGELYCIEEGTVHSSTVNVYDDDVLSSGTSHASPTVTTPDAAAVLSVTVGAKCSSLFDEADLESDFEALVDEIEVAASDAQLEIVESS
ncbi:MAG: hypothetical protein ABEH35_02020 [Haloarculaceae archaeon]